jgi:hypothetical protein
LVLNNSPKHTRVPVSLFNLNSVTQIWTSTSSLARRDHLKTVHYDAALHTSHVLILEHCSSISITQDLTLTRKLSCRVSMKTEGSLPRWKIIPLNSTQRNSLTRFNIILTSFPKSHNCPLCQRYTY